MPRIVIVGGRLRRSDEFPFAKGAKRGEPARGSAIRLTFTIRYRRGATAFHAPDPVLCVPPAAPAVALLFEHALSGFSERRNVLDAVFLRERIAARPGRHPVGEGLLAGLGERDERGGTEPRVRAAGVSQASSSGGPLFTRSATSSGVLRAPATMRCPLPSGPSLAMPRACTPCSNTPRWSGEHSSGHRLSSDST